MLICGLEAPPYQGVDENRHNIALHTASQSYLKEGDDRRLDAQARTGGLQEAAQAGALVD